MSYIGSTPTTQSFISGTDYFNGDGSTTAFTLSRTVVSPNDIEAVVNNVVQQPNSAYTVSGTTITFTSAPSAGSSNIYVRYLSTTTQSITPSQNTVSYSTWNSDLQNKTWGFKNRIINGGMVIDQRNAGASVGATNGGYTLDRWVANSYASGAVTGKFTVQQTPSATETGYATRVAAGFRNYLAITSSAATSVGSNDIYAIGQVIEGYNLADLAWGTANAKTITLSFWVNSSLTGTFGGALLNDGQDYNYPFSYTISSANTWEYKTITVTGPTSGTWLTTNGAGMYLRIGLGGGSSWAQPAGSWTTSKAYTATGCVNVVSTSGATFYLTGVQLEVGTQATNFDVRSYQQELIMCQRYYQEYGNRYQGAGNYTSLTAMTMGWASSSTDGNFPFTFTVQMRAAPTVNYSNIELWDRIGGSAYAVTSGSGGYTTISQTLFVPGVASGLTTRYPYWIKVQGNGGVGYVNMTAEL